MIKESLIALRKQINKVAFNFGEIVSVEGVTLVSKDEKIIEGSEVFVYDEQGVLIPASDGTYTFEDGSSFDIKEGKALNVSEGEVETVEPIVEPVEVTETELVDVEIVEAPEVESVDEPVSGDTQSISDLQETVNGLIEQVSALTTIVESMGVQMSKSEEMITKLAKYSSAEVIVEKPEVVEVITKKQSRAERIITAK